MSRSSSAERWIEAWPALLRWLAGLGLLGLLLAHATQHLPLPGLARLELQLYDARLRLFAPATPDTRIVILDIDERSLAQLGRWPWKRSLLAAVIEKAFSPQGALLLGLDMVLAEPDDSSGLSTLDALAAGPLRDDRAFTDQLQSLRPSLDHDARLAQVLQRYAVVLGFHLSNADGAARIGALPRPSAAPAVMGPQLNALTDWQGYGANLPSLQQASAQAGFLNALADADGITRRMPLLARHEGQVYAALPLVLAQTLMGNAGITPVRAPLVQGPAPLTGLSLATPRGPLQLPTDGQAAVLVPYRLAGGDYARYSVADLLADRLPADALRGRVVLLGSSAPGLLDQRTTPLASTYPGVAVHASVLSGLLDGSLASAPGHGPALEAGVLLLMGLSLLWLLPRLSWPGVITIALLWLALLLALNFGAWVWARQALPLATGLLLLPGLLGLHLLFAYLGERGAKRRLGALFGHYVPPALVQEMSLHPGRYSMASRSADLTVLFADVRGFTGIAERLAPADLAALMHDYFSAMTEIVGAHRGTLDKYMGDALMAFWGAPLDDGDHALHAVQASLAMQAELARLNARFAANGRPQLAISIGIHSGAMVVGDLGSRQRRAYTVLGDNVNLAARLQELCGRRGAGLLISEATHARLGGALPCAALGPVAVRGRQAEVVIYEPLAG